MTEITHSAKLAQGDTDRTFGWSGPAGKLRAQRRADLLKQGAALEWGVTALEIGCGSGVFTELFASTGVLLFAIDISDELLAKAKARKLQRRKVIFARSSIKDMPDYFKFDAILGSSVLHHIKDLPSVLAKLYRMLTPGGRIAFAEPNYLNPQVFLERKLRHVLPCFYYVSDDETAFIRWTLAKALINVGFEDVEITPFDWLHPSTPGWLVPEVDAMGKWLEWIPVVREFAGSLFIQGRKPR